MESFVKNYNFIITKMWKVNLGRAIKEVRLVLKVTPEHHGAWKWVNTVMPELRLLNQNTFFSLTEIDSAMETPSACHIIYEGGDAECEQVHTSGLSFEDFDKIFKEKVAFGHALEKEVPVNNLDRELPMSVVEARKTVKHMDDNF